MRAKAIAGMIVIAMVTRSRILASPRMPGRSNPEPAGESAVDALHRAVLVVVVFAAHLLTA